MTPILESALICPWCKCRSKSVYELIFHVAFTHPRFLVTTEANNDQFKLIISLCETPPLHLNSRVIRDNEKESFYYKSLGASSENAAAKGVILPIHIEASALNSYLDLNHFLHKNQHRIVLSEARASKARSYFHMPFAENMHPEYNADSEDDVEDDMTFGIAREWSLFIASQPIASKRNIKELCIQFAKKYPVLVQKSHYMFMQHLHVLFESHSLDGEDIADILRIINQ